MKAENKLTYIWIGLVFFTILEYVFSELNMAVALIFGAIMTASFIKFYGVANYFLELEHAHKFWKTLALIVVSLFILVVGIIYL